MADRGSLAGGRVSILCPGPSLISWSEISPPRVGVNRATLAWPCDWWVSTDPTPIELAIDQLDAAGTRPKRLFTRRETILKLGYDRPDLHDRVQAMSPVMYEDLDLPVAANDAAIPWGWTSSTAALAIAAWLDAGVIHVYGADMGEFSTAPEDYDGYNDVRYNRTADRWRVERDVWAKVVDWLTRLGHEVIRHGSA